MTENITIRWNTGKIEMPLQTLIDLPLSKVKQILAAEEIDPDAAKETVYNYTAAAIDALPEWMKKERERLAKVLAIAAPGKRERVTADVKAMQRIIKNAGRREVEGVFMTGELFTVCDGYRAIRMVNNPSAILPRVDTTKCRPVDLSSVFSDARGRCNTEIKLPDVKTLKHVYKAAKMDGAFSAQNVYSVFKGRAVNVYYDFGPGLPAVDCAFLIDMLEAMPGCRAFVGNSLSAPLYFTAEDMDGILLPIRKGYDHAAESAAIGPAVLPPVPSAPVVTMEDAPALESAEDTAPDMEKDTTTITAAEDTAPAADPAEVHDDTAEAVPEVPAAVTIINTSFIAAYEAIYNRLYDSAPDDHGLHKLAADACAAFDRLQSAGNNALFCAALAAFCRLRHDAVSSDREAAAFILALRDAIRAGIREDEKALATTPDAPPGRSAPVQVINALVYAMEAPPGIHAALPCSARSAPVLRRHTVHAAQPRASPRRCPSAFQSTSIHINMGGITMLDISAFVSNLNGEISLVYHGGNRYTITEAPRGFDGYELAVDILDDDFEDIIETRTYAASSVSSAIATIEAIERGEEV